MQTEHSVSPRGGTALPILAVLTALLLFLVPASTTYGAGDQNSITSHDPNGVVGYTSLALDVNGNPVVSYGALLGAGLRVLHCDDPNCDGVGESITTPDVGPASEVSLVLDAAGYPVVSYRSAGDLKILHCDDPNCDGVGESIVIAEANSPAGTGWYTSIALDAAGNPVVSYTTNTDLRLLHCNDPNCDGLGETITSPDTTSLVDEFTSLVLDANGYPVVSYHDSHNDDLKLLHCNDPNCDGVGESITSPDTAGNVGGWTSLALDGNGFPVVSYEDFGNGDLKLLHCDDPNCDGVGESITTLDAVGDVGRFSSLRLDGNGYPVIAHHDRTLEDLKILHCADPNCAGVGSITSPDTAGVVGLYVSLALDGSGSPVVSYHRFKDGAETLSKSSAYFIAATRTARATSPHPSGESL